MCQMISIAVGIAAIVTSFFSLLWPWILVAIPEAFLAFQLWAARKRHWQPLPELSPAANEMFAKYGHYYTLPFVFADFSSSATTLQIGGIVVAIVGAFRGFWWGLAIGAVNAVVMHLLAYNLSPTGGLTEPEEKAAHKEVLEYMREQVLRGSGMSKKSDAAEIAQVLVEEFVEGDSLGGEWDATIPAHAMPRYRAKVLLYRVALVLMALLSEETKNVQCLRLREAFEGLMFGMPGAETGPDAEQIKELEKVRHAMKCLNDLLFPAEKPRQMSWAKAWLQEIGVEVTNPADLAFFAMCWMGEYTMVVRTVQELTALELS